MKEINIDGKTFQYEVNSFECGEYGAFTGYETLFYYGSTEIVRKKYLVFGKDIIENKPTFAFSLLLDIEDPNYTKEEIKKLLDAKIKIMNRKIEIKNGEII